MKLPEWFKEAPCIGHDEMFMSASEDNKVAAISMCSQCVWQTECVSYAQEFSPKFGTWGGVISRDLGKVLTSG